MLISRRASRRTSAIAGLVGLILTVAGGTMSAAPAQASTSGVDDGWNYIDDGTSVEVTGYANDCDVAPYSPCTLRIPSSINSKPVTSVATTGWSQVGTIASLTIPNSVTAFGGFSRQSIKGVTFQSGSSITTLPAQAFYGMGVLNSVTLPDHLLTLPDAAFVWDEALRSITLPDTITTINGENGLFRYTGITTVNIPRDLVEINGGAFENMNLGAVDLPLGLRTIGHDAFKHATITSLTMPPGLRTIGYSAFDGALGSGINSLNFPSGLTTIGDYAFADNSLTSVTFPRSLTSIGDYGFAYNNFSSTPGIPAGTSVGTGVFAIRGTLSNGVTWSDSGSEVTITGCTADCADHDVEIPSSINGHAVTSAATIGWSQVGTIASLTIPNSVTAFGGWFSRQSIKGVTFQSGSSITTLPAQAFYGMDVLNSVTLPDHLLTLPDETFKWDEALTSITLPASVRTISGSAFGPYLYPTITYTAPVFAGIGNFSGQVGSPYSHTFGASGAAMSVTDGTLPDGLSLDADSGVLSGTPTSPGTFHFKIRATNAAPSSPYDSSEVTLTIAGPPVVTPIATPTPAPSTSASAPAPLTSASAVPAVSPGSVPSAPVASGQPLASVPAGVAVLSAAEQTSAQVVTVSAPASTSIAAAPVVTVPTNAPVAPIVGGLPPNTPFEAGMNASPFTRMREQASSRFTPIGKTRSNAAGRAKVPAFKASRPGVYTIRLTAPSGKAYYVKVKVTARGHARR